MLLVEHGMVAHPPGLVRTYFHGLASFLSVLYSVSLLRCCRLCSVLLTADFLCLSASVRARRQAQRHHEKSPPNKRVSHLFLPLHRERKKEEKKSACSPVKSTGSALASDHLETREHTFRGAFKVSHAESLAVQLRGRIYTRNIPDITKCNKAVDI